MRMAVFFPYHPDMKTLVEFRQELIDWEIVGFASYREDEHLINPLNLVLDLEAPSLEQLLNDCDTVVLLDNYRGCRVEKYYQVIEDAIARNKDIFVTPLARSQLDLARYEDYYQILEQNPDCMETINAEYSAREGATDSKLYQIEIPVVGILGQGKNCDKFVNLLLMKQVLEEDYDPVTVSSNALGVLFGCYTIPSFLYENIPFQEKIIKFNYFVRRISEDGDPDALVIGVPEGVMPFRRQEFHHFAEYPHVISSAIDFDLVILCTYFLTGSKLESVLKLFVEFCRNKFSVPVGAVSVSRISIEAPNEESSKIDFEHLRRSYLDKYYPDLNSLILPMVNMLDFKQAKTALKASIIRLQENISVI